MSKLTADLFSQLPDELQEKILQDVPADKLNQIEVIGPDDIDPQQSMKVMQEVLFSVGRKKAIIIIIEMLKFIGDNIGCADAPQEVQAAVHANLLQQFAERADQLLAEGGFEDGD